jgi:hypothetical protein
MINRSLAYRKSAKGVEAIANRQSGLAPKLRSVLIMVDGKKTGEDLYKVCTALGDAQAMLAELVTGALIEPVTGGSVAAVSSAGAPAAPAAAASASGLGAVSQPGPSLAEAKRLAVRLLKEILGPLADDSCIAVEGSKNIEQYTAAVKKAYTHVRNVRGGEVAGRFGQEIEANFPVL